MKKFKVIFVSLILIFVGCFFAGCGFIGKDGTQITISEDGYWVIDGQKTEYKVAAEDGEKGEKGEKGDPASISIDEEGYWVIDGKPTNVKARGEDGQDGTDGKDGEDGKDGQDGMDGTQITISEDGYWVLDGESTTSRAVGKDGTNGTDGVNGTVVTIEDGYWVLDGVKTNIRAEAQDGEDGEDGQTPTVEIIGGYWYINGQPTGVDARGEAGNDGEDGTQITISADGYWVLDGVKTNVRAKAQDGEDGEDGQTPTVEIIDGYWYINGQPTGVDARGQNGEDGEDGKSAYELAVLNGFDGTEEEWLETLGITQVEAKNFNKSINKALVSSVAILSCFNNSTSASLSGAGVIIQDDKDAGDAYILTCYHVVYDTQFSNPNATTIRCYLYGQYRYSGSLLTNYVMPATLIGYSVSNDIAVLKISNSDIYRNSIAEPVTYRDSDELNICDDVLVLGNPGSLDFSASTGIVSMESEIINYP
ncbi:MAG: serine protease, partial [Clostridia bacterium]|nr:serine protease [Clostridia bacterium]